MYNSYNDFMNDSPRLWQITFNRAPAKTRYADSHTVNVVAETIEEALAKVRAEYPESKMLAAQHKGKIDL